MSYTVLLVDDHDLIRQGLRRAFDRSPDADVVAEVACVADALEAAREIVPDVVVCDIKLPDGSGLDVVRTLRSQRDDVGLVVLTMYGDDDHLFEALDAGASAYITKDAPSDEVVAAAHLASQSPSSFTAANLAEAMRRREQLDRPKLSPREHEVLQLLAQGLRVAEISRKLFISESTAKTHVANIYDKLSVSNRAEAVMKAVEVKLVVPAWSQKPA